MLPGQILDGERALAPAIGVVALPDPPFGALEIGQQVGIAPATVAHLRPAVIVHALTATVDVTVARTRSDEYLAARRMDAAPADRRPGPGPVARQRGV